MIEVKNLQYTYPGAAQSAVRGLNFSVADGEIFGFLGPSGAGKSTTQKILTGLLTGYQGFISMFERDLQVWGADLYERIGVSFELPNHYLKLTGRENLAYFSALYSRPRYSPLELLSWVGLEDDADMPVGQYSKGMKNRLTLARALLHDPVLLFLDEPTSGLDPFNARRVKELILAQKQAGKTIFLTTHDMTVADELCDRVAFIVDGEINVIAAPRVLKLEHGQPNVRIEFGENGHPDRAEFPLTGLGQNGQFLELLRLERVQTIHSLEATLEDVFIRVTGRSLA